MYTFDRGFYKKHRLFCDLQENEIAPYMVGALLYTPATNSHLTDAILADKIPSPYSLALCLEDAISNAAIDYAEQNIINIFSVLHHALDCGDIGIERLPQIFIRIRKPEQIEKLYQQLSGSGSLLTGFVVPKYSLDCCDAYNAAICNLNLHADHKIYMMPIMETSDLFSLSKRAVLLEDLKRKIDGIKEYTLCVRVGGNDFCRHYGLRRHADETIYEIEVLKHMLSDILTTFAHDYVVSGPVWEYFSGQDNQWAAGLKKELQYDQLNGFIGKTVIHPKQIPMVNESLCVCNSDFLDACRILQYKGDLAMVEKSADGSRMNEMKTHLPWAEKILLLASIYGVKQNAE